MSITLRQMEKLNSENIVLKFREGSAQNYFDILLDTFGGELVGNTYLVNKPGTYIKMLLYNVIPEFEILLTNSTTNRKATTERLPDNDPNFFHLYIIKEGGPNQSYNNQQQYLEAGSTKGVFLYNGLFNVVSTYPANVTFKSVAFKISRNALHSIMPESTPIFKQLFSSSEPIAYHTILPVELESIIEDVFKFSKSEFGRTPLTIARCLELFTLYLSSLKLQFEKDELNGLYIDDYNRLLEVKSKLLSSFDQIVNIESIANEFGVSISKLKRDFKTLYNTSIYKFYTHAKMDEAYRRLKTGDFSVKDVGYDLGYQNISKFSEMFKKVKGITPKEVMPL